MNAPSKNHGEGKSVILGQQRKILPLLIDASVFVGPK